MKDITDFLSYLKLPFIRENYEVMGKTAARNQWDHIVKCYINIPKIRSKIPIWSA